MSHAYDTPTPNRSTLGGAFIRFLLIILGAVLTGFGLLFTTAALSIIVEESDGDMVFLLPFTFATFIGGIVIVVMQLRAAREARESGYADDASEQVVSVIPLTPPSRTSDDHPTAGKAPEEVVAPAPAVEPPPTVPAPAPAPAPSPSPKPHEPTEDVANLVVRSNDLFATLRDLTRHEQTPGSNRHHLATMLQAAGVLDWEDAPTCEGGRLTHNSHFWIRLSPDRLAPEQYDTLIAAEAALSVNQDLPDVRTLPLDDEEAELACSQLMRSMADQPIERPAFTNEGLLAAYRHTNDDETPGEWVVRSQICSAAECVRTPFRVVYDLRANVAEGLVAILLEVPRPRCMAIFTANGKQQITYARAYALRLSTLLARAAFAASPKIRHVVINCHEHMSDETILSLDISAPVLEALLDVARSEDLDSSFPTSDAIRASLGREDEDWLGPVDPFVEHDSHLCLPAHATTYPELDTREASPAVARTCHATRICDLGINESAARVHAWDAIEGSLGTTTEEAVSKLVSARDATHDITVAEACTRTIQALVEGTVELEDNNALAMLFIDGSALERAVEKSSTLIDEDHWSYDPEAAIQVLEAALAPIEDMGANLDDETTVYRYFGSIAERIHHNAAINEGGREIRLVPDAYFNAHCNASIALAKLDRNEEALAHADVCLRLAPTSSFAAMRKVRILENMSRVYEAADLIIEALHHAVTPRDAAVCHYRLAYMEWKLGREDLAAACYRRALTWDTEMSSQAAEELDDLVASSPNLETPTAEQADALLAREGIPLGCVRTDQEHTLAAAVACMDDGALFTARPLAAVLFGMTSDDVVMGIYRSLNVSV